MKYSDIQRLCENGLITDQQRQQIIEHFQLKEESSRFMIIISFLGAVLVAAGIVLLIAANWEEIPAGVKIVVGILLMLGAHAGGWYLREVQQRYCKTGEALHLLGAVLFLGNIALIGQIYHLSSRTPNAFLLWWLGIAALPWLLHSKTLHILSLLALSIWFGLEINEHGSVIFLGDDYAQLVVYALLGLIYLGAGYSLRQTYYDDMAPITERVGLLVFHIFSYPLLWRFFYWRFDQLTAACYWLFPAICGLAVVLFALTLPKVDNLTRQWRWTWGLTLAGGVALLAGGFNAPSYENYGQMDTTYQHLAALALFVFCLVQIRVGVHLRSAFLINLGTVFITLNLIATYIVLIDSMGRTGLVFLISGVFLIVFGVYLEKKRRTLIKQINEPSI